MLAYRQLKDTGINPRGCRASRRWLANCPGARLTQVPIGVSVIQTRLFIRLGQQLFQIAGGRFAFRHGIGEFHPCPEIRGQSDGGRGGDFV